MNTTLATLSETFSSFLSGSRFADLVSIVLTVIAILVAFRIIRTLVLKLVGDRGSPQIRFIVKRGIGYAGSVVAVMTVFNRLGIDFTAVLGAAGIVGVAAGFAAQTSVSNIISGFFVMTERAFRIGDTLKIDAASGVVESFSLLSIKLRTPDNQLIRIPNETIIKANLVNMSHFENRRCDMRFGVSYGTDLRAVREALLGIAAENEFALKDSEPVIVFDSFTPSSIEILFGVWGKKEQFLDLKNSLMIEVSERFRRDGIEIPQAKLDVRVNPAN